MSVLFSKPVFQHTNCQLIFSLPFVGAVGNSNTAQFHIQANPTVQKMPLGLPRDCCVGGEVTLSAIIYVHSYNIYIRLILVPAIILVKYKVIVG